MDEEVKVEGVEVEETPVTEETVETTEEMPKEEETPEAAA